MTRSFHGAIVRTLSVRWWVHMPGLQQLPAKKKFYATGVFMSIGVLWIID